jgi:hypothetical protein
LLSAVRAVLVLAGIPKYYAVPLIIVILPVIYMTTTGEYWIGDSVKAYAAVFLRYHFSKEGHSEFV